MDWDDLDPKTKKPKPKDLSPLGVADLQAYIADLKAEIARTELELTKRDATRAGAEAFFRKS
mgnify:CR=1 FL=1|jgi:uncharacterized small protein (DUF1192 family)